MPENPPTPNIDALTAEQRFTMAGEGIAKMAIGLAEACAVLQIPRPTDPNEGPMGKLNRFLLDTLGLPRAALTASRGPVALALLEMKFRQELAGLPTTPDATQG